MTQEEKSQVYQAGGRERKERQRASMTQEEREQDLEDARTRRARNHASEVEDKTARQAAASRKLKEMLYKANGHVSELPPPEDWPDVNQCPYSAMFTFMANSGCWRFADSNRLPRETDQEGVTDPEHSADDLSWMTSLDKDELQGIDRLVEEINHEGVTDGEKVSFIENFEELTLKLDSSLPPC